MSERTERMLFLGKAGDETAVRAATCLQQHFPRTDLVWAKRGEKSPSVGTQYDFIFSYLCPWVIPADVLSSARRASINFHPGPPEYPGIGCTNFALYDEASEYGATCHHMRPEVDSGTIIRVLRFPVHSTDSVLTVTQRCYTCISILFYDLVDTILRGGDLPVSNETWTRKAYRRSDFNELLKLTHDMSEDEIRRRIRATTFPGYPCASFADNPRPGKS